MINRIHASYRRPLMFAIGLHLLLVLLLILQLPTHPAQLAGQAPKAPHVMIKAQAVSQKEVNAAIAHIVKNEQRQQRAAKVALAKAEHAAKNMRRLREREARRVAALKAKQNKILHTSHELTSALKHQKAALTQQKHAAAHLHAEQRALANKIAAQKTALVKQAKALKQQKANAAHKAKALAQRLASAQASLQRKLLQQELRHEQQVIANLHQKQTNNVIAQFKAKILQAISQHWMVPAFAVNSNLTCQFMIALAPGGVVLKAELLKSSGNAALDRSARVAILKASPLPVPGDPALFNQFRQLRLSVSPKQIVSAQR